MIKYEWRDSLDPDEVAELKDLLDRAAAYDAAPEYSTIDFEDVQRSLTNNDSRAKHLVIWMLPYGTALGAPDEPERVAGLMRLITGDDGTARATIVIDPRLRSIGIVTLLLEQVGLDTSGPDGWLGTGAHTVTAWAQGNHPAAARLSNRFLIPRTRRVWKLIRSTDSAEDATAAPVLEHLSASALDDAQWADFTAKADIFGLRDAGRVVGAVELDRTPSDSEEFGRCATITTYRATPTASVPERRRLLEGAAAIAHETGFDGLIAYVDSDDAHWVNAARLAGFQHDRTDVLLQLGAQR